MIRTLFLIFIYGLTAWRLTFVFFADPELISSVASRLSSLEDGSAERPFVFRTLMPSLIYYLHKALPDSMNKLLEKAYHHDWGQFYWKKFQWEHFSGQNSFISIYFLAFVLVILCFFTTLFVFRKLTKDCLDITDWQADIFPLWGALLLPGFFHYASYIYDPSVILFSSLMLLTIWNRNNFWFFLIFLIATVNKETSLFYLAPWALRNYSQISKNKFVIYLGTLILAWVAIKLALYWRYHLNPGVNILWTFSRNLEILSHHLIRTFSVVWIFAIWAFLIFYKKEAKPPFLIKSFHLIFWPMLGTALIWGWVDEVRIFFDLYPIIYLLSIPTVLIIFKIPSPFTKSV